MPLLKLAIPLLKRFSFFLSLLFLAILIAVPKAQATPVQDLMSRMEGLEKQLEEVQKQQAALLDKTQELSEKLDTVKIWARRG